MYRKEAKDLLQNQVITNKSEEERIIRELYDNFVEDMELGKPFIPQLSKQEVCLKIALIESDDQETKYVRTMSLNQVNKGEVRANIKKQGWESIKI